MFLGIDSSTQSLSGLLIDPATGQIVHQTSVNFGTDLPQFGSPSGFIPGGKNGEVHANPRMWLEALDLMLARLSAAADLSKVVAIAGSGQQHGSVYLDATFTERLTSLEASGTLSDQLSPALSRATSPIWMDTSTGDECAEITAAAGGDETIRKISGSAAIERFTGPQIRRFYKTDPEGYGRTARVHLVSSFLASVLAGQDAAIDPGDGSGMNLMDLTSSAWSELLLDATAPGLRAKLPAIAPTQSTTGTIAAYFLKYGFTRTCTVARFTGDNPASLVGMGATAPGNIVISLGTSDTFFAAMEGPKTDPAGFGHVFGNPAGGFMSLICFRNGSLAREALRDELGLDWSAFDVAGLSHSPAGNDGNLMLPFFGVEITPRGDFDGPVRKGDPAFETGGNPRAQVRALLEGQFLNMRLHSQWIGVKPDRIRLTGGASQNNGIARLVADIFQAPVERLATGNSAALGAALIAAASAGEDLSKLQAIFCTTAADSRIEPNNSAATIYDQALVSYRELLDSNLHLNS
jgi:xylulokinase